MNLQYRKLFDFLGRFCIATTFAVAIPSKIFNFQIFLGSIASKGIPVPIATFLLVCAIIFMILGVGFLVVSRDQNIGSVFLLIFLVPTTLIMHLQPFQPIAFFMNIGLIGGLMISLTRTSKISNSRYKNSIDSIFDALDTFFKRFISG